jgi:rhomboid protease GluP
MSSPVDPALKAEWDAKRAPRPAPVLTTAIIALLTIVFGAEYTFNVGPAPGLAPGDNSLIALGAISRNLVIGAGEPWRVITSALLHANPAHIIGNCIVLFLAGASLERLVGRAWLGATFVVCGLAGSLAALVCDPPGDFGVGASGAIMGLLSAAFVLSFHPHAASIRRAIQFASARTAIPALIPFSAVEGGVHVGYNCHGGGFLAGLVMGFVMRALWSPDRVHPGGERAASWIGWGGLALAGLSFLLVAVHYPDYAQAGERYAGELPALNDQTVRTPAFATETAALVRLYPHDPRAHLLRSAYFVNARNLPDAESETRAALTEKDAFGQFPGLEPELHLFMASILLAEGNRVQAEVEADPWCLQKYPDRGAEELRENLLTAGLCGGWQAEGAAAEH